MNKNRIFKILTLIGIILIGVVVFYFGWNCPFKKAFHLACPGCGITRAFYSLLELDILSAIRYNILAIPLFLILVVSVVLLIIEIIFNKNVYFKELFRQVYLNADFIFIILLVTMIINNINAI